MDAVSARDELLINLSGQVDRVGATLVGSGAKTQ